MIFVQNRFKYIYPSLEDDSLFLLDKFNHGKNLHFILGANVFSSYVQRYFQKKTSQILNVAEDILADLLEFFHKKIKDKLVRITVFDNFYKRRTYLFNFKYFSKFLEFINFIFSEIRTTSDCDYLELLNKKVKMTFFEVKAFEVSGSVFQYFEDGIENNIEIKASFGVVHDSTTSSDFYFLDPKTFQSIKEEITRQKRMKILYKNKIEEVDIPYDWQRVYKLDSRDITQVLEVFKSTKKLIGKPFELYFGFLGKKLYITGINFEYDGVIDFTDFQILEGGEYHTKNFMNEIKNNIHLEISEDFSKNLSILEQHDVFYSGKSKLESNSILSERLKSSLSRL